MLERRAHGGAGEDPIEVVCEIRVLLEVAGEIVIQSPSTRPEAL